MIFSIIPAKPFDQAKTRLSPILPVTGRVNLSRHLLQRTIKVALAIGEVVVISRDAAVRRLAKQAGAWALVESGHSLNEALQQATDWSILQGVEAVFIIPADLPLLSAAALADIVRVGSHSPAVVIAPCRRQDGTNVLFTRPPGLIPFSFGPGSFQRHQTAAGQAGLEPVIYHSPIVALDLDLPEDLAVLKELSFDQEWQAELRLLDR